MSRANTGPRRWPDLMIGLLVLLLLGGFGTLLLRGTPQNATTAGTPTTQPTSEASIPGAPGTADTGSVAAAPITQAPTTEPVAPPTQDSAATTDPSTDTTAAAPAATDAPIIEAAPIGTAPVTDPASTTDATTDPATEPAADPAATPGNPAPRPEGAVPTSEQRVPLRSDYRITLGTFSSEAAAQSAAAPVQGIGYTVYPIDVGSQVVAQVGPFADEASARQALADVQRAYPRAVLYPPRDRAASTDSSGANPGDRAAPAPDTASAPAPAPSGPTYLQVGAFDRVESAQNLVQQLRDLGYNPTVNAPEGKKVTVLVGPYENPAALTRTETRLADNGLDSFRVR
ncbi:SPOR domain-containing protein [Deinococcus depolymerans]|uniref:SPOR domain-containing protein n=1 Tax=Deinococcus depolymerans TaxID=392408 RepID=A0ABP3LUI0_9DEIO